MTSTATPASSTDSRAVYGLRLATKIIAEFCHERMLHPISLSGSSASSSTAGTYLIIADDQHTEYIFRAEVLALDNWVIEESSLRRLHRGTPTPIDPLTMLIDLRDCLAIPVAALPGYLEEFVNTLSIGTDRPADLRVSAADLAHADFQTIEQTMTEGHPCIVANAGRIGFSADDIERYAPERGPRCRLVWIAARRDRCDVATVSGTDIDSLMRTELGEPTLAAFDAVLIGRGLDPDDFHYIPVHPWQWTEKIARIHAIDIAEQASTSPPSRRYAPGWSPSTTAPSR